MRWYFLAWKRMFDFRGRSRRKEYWLFALFHLIVLCIFGFAVGVIPYTPGQGPYTVAAIFRAGVLILLGLYFLGSCIVNLSLLIRRLHDINATGWWALVVFVPMGSLVLFIFTLIKGTEGENKYGHNPKMNPCLDVF